MYVSITNKIVKVWHLALDSVPKYSKHLWKNLKYTASAMNSPYKRKIIKSLEQMNVLSKYVSTFEKNWDKYNWITFKFQFPSGSCSTE